MEMACKREIMQEHMLGTGSRKDENDIHKGKLFKKSPEIRGVKVLPDIIIIDDDDSGEVENHNTSEDVELCEGDYESDVGSRSHRQYHASQPSCYGYGNDNRDFKKVGPSHKRTRKGEKRPVQIVFDNTKESSTSSDCEIIEDVGGQFRHEWEKASRRKQLGKSWSCQAESEESTTATNATSPLARKRLQRAEKFQYQETSLSIQGRSDPCQSGSSIPSFQKGRDEEENKITMPKIPLLFDQQDSNNVASDARSESSSDSADDESEAISSSFGNDTDAFNEGTSSSRLKSVMIESNDDIISGGKGNHFIEYADNELQKQLFEAQVSSAMRKMAKESEEFQHTQGQERTLWQDPQYQLKKHKADADLKGKSKTKELIRYI